MYRVWKRRGGSPWPLASPGVLTCVLHFTCPQFCVHPHIQDCRWSCFKTQLWDAEVGKEHKSTLLRESLPLTHPLLTSYLGELSPTTPSSKKIWEIQPFILGGIEQELMFSWEKRFPAYWKQLLNNLLFHSKGITQGNFKGKWEEQMLGSCEHFQ